MIYAIIVVSVLLLFMVVLVWLRKVQFDAVHRNFLDLIDNFGGKVVRSGFAIRPRYSGKFKELPLAISISSEKKSKDRSRLYYIAVYLKSVSEYNFTIMSLDWLDGRDHSKEGKSFVRKIFDEQYVVEVTDKQLLKKLDFNGIEKVVGKIDPFAYVLVSRRGVILERVSVNLIQDTEFENLRRLVEGIYRLSILHPGSSEAQPAKA